MDFVFEFPEDDHKNNGILVFVDRFSEMVHLAAVPESITAHAVLVSFSTRYFDSTGYPVNSYPTVTLGSRQNSGKPCSVLLEHD